MFWVHALHSLMLPGLGQSIIQCLWESFPETSGDILEGVDALGRVADAVAHRVRLVLQQPPHLDREKDTFHENHEKDTLHDKDPRSGSRSSRTGLCTQRRAARPPPTSTVHVTTNDGEWFPVGGWGGVSGWLV